MGVIAKYKFDSSIYDNFIPEFNSEFIDYTVTDINNGDNTITRTISHDTLKPTLIRFGSTDISGQGDYTKQQSLLEIIELNINNSITDMRLMFYPCNNLTSVNLSNFDTSSVTNMYAMFSGCSSLTSLDLSNFNTSSVTDMSVMFNSCSLLTTLDLSSFDTSSVTTMAGMFGGCSSLTSLDLSNFNTSNVNTMLSMFSNCSSLTSLDLSSFDTSKVNSMQSLFNGCSALTSVNLSNFNTSSVNHMIQMFNNCSSLTSLDLSNFNTSSVNNMSYMFASCSSLTSLDLSSFNTSKVTNMQSMFNKCSSLTELNISNFITSSVTDMVSMFSGCSSLTSLDVSNFNTSSVNNMRGMFYNCSSLTSLDVSKFNTSKVTTMASMFANCSSLTSLDLSSFDTSKVKYMNDMFNKCPLLTSLGLLYSTSTTINSLSTQLGTSVARDIYYLDANPIELTAQENINYVEYKETVSSNTITLNGLPNGVCDELDLVTGRYVKRVGEIVLNGSETSWFDPETVLSNVIVDGTHIFSFTIGTWIKDCGHNTLICDKYPTNLLNVRNSGNQSNLIGIYNNDAYFGYRQMALRLPSSVADSVDELQTYLASNPITVKYQLENPVILYPSDEGYPLTSQPTTPKSYSTSSILLSSDTITPSFKYSLKTDNYYDIQGIDTTSTYTTYNITGNFLNQTNLTTNYTGTLDKGTSKRVVVEGTNPMVIMGSKINDVPYFTGLKNFKTKQITLPDGNTGYSVVRNTGKNLLHVGKSCENSERFGITVSFDPVLQTVTVNGTSAIDNICFSISKFSKMMLKDKSYSLSFYLISGTADTISFRINDINWEYSMGQTLGKESTTNSVTQTFLKNIKYIDASIRINANKTFNNAVFKVMLEEGSTATAYEPYFENEVYVDEELELRSLPDGTCDELDLNTGILTRKVGTHNITYIDSIARNLNDVVVFDIKNSKFATPSTNINVVQCNSLPNLGLDGTWSGKVGLSQASNGHYLQLCIEKEKLSSPDYHGFVNYIKSHPISVQYLRETPIRTQLSLKTKGNYKKVEINGINGFNHRNDCTYNNFYNVYKNISDSIGSGLRGFTDKFRFLSTGISNDETESCFFWASNIYFRINKNKINAVMTTEAFNEYFSINPVTYWYKSSSVIALTTVNQPLYINKGHLIQSSDVAGTLKYSLPTTNYYHLRDLKPNTSYKLLYTSGACSINGQALSSPTTITTGNAIQSYYALINSNVLPAMYEGSPNVKYTTNYLEDVCYNVGDNVISNCGKNLINENTNCAGFTYSNGQLSFGSDIELGKNIIDSFRLAEGTYTLSVNKISADFTGDIQFGLFKVGNYDKWLADGSVISFSYTSNQNNGLYTSQFTLDSASDVEFVIFRHGNGVINSFVCNIQLEEGSTATAYEPYKSNIISPVLTDKLHLRSLPDGTCDTFNAKTGVITRRVGVIKLDGSRNWNGPATEVTGDDIICKWTGIRDAKPGSICLATPSIQTPNYSFGLVNKRCIMIGTDTIVLSLTKSELGMLNHAEYLAKYPITLYYALKSPTYETISTMSTNETNSAFANGHTILTNNGVAPGLQYGLKTNNYYSLPTLASGNYTVNTNGSYILNGETREAHGQSNITVGTVTEKKLFCSNPITIAEGELEYLPMVDDVNTTTNASVTFSKADGSNAIALDLSGYALNSLPNGVCDEIDVKNGMHIQRVGVVTIDENGYNGVKDENIIIDSLLTTNILHSNPRFKTLILRYTNLNFKNPSDHGTVYAKGFNSISWSYNTTPHHIIYQWGDTTADLVGSIDTYRYPEIVDPENRYNAYDFFAAHPTTVYYELEQPIVTPITELNLPKVYAGGKVTVTADNVLPKVKYRYPTNNSFLVDKLLPSTTYTLRTGNAKNFYIGGTFYNRSNWIYQFTTSSSLSNRLMIFENNATDNSINPCLLMGSKDKYDLIPNRMEYNLIKSPYLDNTSIKLRSVHKNLFDLSRMKEVQWFGGIVENQNNIKNVTIDLLNNSITTKVDNSGHGGYGYELYLEPNKQYIIHLDFEGDSERTDIRGFFDISVVIWPDNRINVNKNGHYYKVFSTSTGKVRLTCNKLGGTYAKFSNIMITEYHDDTSVPEYEPYKEVVTTISGLSQGLMSIPGTDVRDELIIDNDSRKVTHIKRVGSIQLTKELLDSTLSSDHQSYNMFNCSLTNTKPHSKMVINAPLTEIDNTGYTVNLANSIGILIVEKGRIQLVYDPMNMGDTTRIGKEAKDQILHIIDKYKPIAYYELEKPVITEYRVDNRPMAFKAGHVMLDTANPAQIEAKYAINQAAQIDNVNTTISLHDKEIEEIMDLAGILLDAQVENTMLRYSIMGDGLADSNEEIDETLASLNETMI